MEQPVVDSVEVDGPEIAQAEPSESKVVSAFDAPESDDSPDVDLLDEQTPAEDDLEDEVEGVKLRGKKDIVEKLKAERLMHADYTRKTQELSEQRKAFEASAAQQAQLTQNYLREVAQIVSVDERLNQYSQVDWQKFSDNDPQAAQKAWIEYQQLREAKGQLVNSLTQRQQQAALQAQQESAKQLQEAAAVVAREIKGWGPQRQSELRKFATDIGYPAEVLAGVTQPAFIKILDMAQKYHQLQQKRSTQAQSPAPAPVTKVPGAANSSAKKLSQMSDAEYAEARRKYIARHR